MCTEIPTFDVEIMKKIINLGPYKGYVVVYDWGALNIKQFLSIICVLTD